MILRRCSVLLGCALLVQVMLLTLPSLKSWAMPPEQAGQHVGKSGTVEGVVLQVSQSAKGYVFLNMGGKYPNHVFTGWVPATAVESIGLDYLRSIEGKKVSLAGKISNYKGQIQMIITKRDQVIAVE